MSWLTVVQNISQFITGTFGSTLCIIAVAIAGARAMLHGHWGQFWSAIGGGTILMSSAWTINTFMGRLSRRTPPSCLIALTAPVRATGPAPPRGSVNHGDRGEA